MVNQIQSITIIKTVNEPQKTQEVKKEKKQTSMSPDTTVFSKSVSKLVSDLRTPVSTGKEQDPLAPSKGMVMLNTGINTTSGTLNNLYTTAGGIFNVDAIGSSVKSSVIQRGIISTVRNGIYLATGQENGTEAVGRFTADISTGAFTALGSTVASRTVAAGLSAVGLIGGWPVKIATTAASWMVGNYLELKMYQTGVHSGIRKTITKGLDYVVDKINHIIHPKEK